MTQREQTVLAILAAIASDRTTQAEHDDLISMLKGVWSGHQDYLDGAIADSLSPAGRGEFLRQAYATVKGNLEPFASTTAYGSRQPVAGMLAGGMMLLTSDAQQQESCHYWAGEAVRHFANLNATDLATFSISNPISSPIQDGTPVTAGQSLPSLWEQALAGLRNHPSPEIPVGATEAFARHVLSLRDGRPGAWEQAALRERRPLILVVDRAADRGKHKGYVLQLRLQLRAGGQNHLYIPPQHSLYEVFGPDFKRAIQQAIQDNLADWQQQANRCDIALWIDWTEIEEGHIDARAIDGTSPYGAVTTAIRHLIRNLPYPEDIAVAIALKSGLRPQQRRRLAAVDLDTVRAKLDAAAEHLSGRRPFVKRVALYDDTGMRAVRKEYAGVPIEFAANPDEISSLVRKSDDEPADWDLIFEDQIKAAISSLGNGPWLTIYSHRSRDGKTVVAERVWRVSVRRKDDRRRIDCRKQRITTCNQLIAAIVRQLSRPNDRLIPGSSDSGERLAKAVTWPFALLIDSIETVSDTTERQAARRFLQDFLAELQRRAMNDQKVIVTLTDSRPLNLEGEIAYELTPPHHDRLTLLLRQQAPAYMARLAQTAETTALLASLYRRVDYDLGALIEFARRLRRNQDLAAVIAQYEPHAYQPGEKAYRRLTDEGRRLFCALALLPQGADAAIAGALGIDYRSAEESLRAQRNVLVSNDEWPHDRLALRQRLLAFASRELDKYDPQQMETALAQHYEQLLLRTDSLGKIDTMAANAAIEADIDNIRALILRAAERGRQEDCRLVIRLASRLAAYYWWNHGMEGQDLLMLALHCAAKLSNPADPIEPIGQEAMCRYRIADLSRRFGHYSSARLHYTLALGVYQQCVAEAGPESGQGSEQDRHGYRLNLARTYKGFADCLRRQSDYAGAIENYTAAAKILQDLNETRDLAHAIKGRGAALRGQGNLVQALAGFRTALELFTREAELLGQANCKREIAEALVLQGAYAEAERNLADARELYRTLGSKIGEAHCLRGSGEIDVMCNRFDLAVANYDRAEKIYQTNIDLLGWVRCMRLQALISRLTARQPETSDADRDRHRRQAQQNFAAARQHYMDMWVPIGVAKCILGLGDLARDRGDYMAACSLYHAAHNTFQRRGAAVFAAICRRDLGEVYLLLGNEAMAANRGPQARNRFIEAGAWFNSAASEFVHPERGCRHWLMHCVIGIAAANIGMKQLTVDDVTNSRVAEDYYRSIGDERGLRKFDALHDQIVAEYAELWQQSVRADPRPAEAGIVEPPTYAIVGAPTPTPAEAGGCNTSTL